MSGETERIRFRRGWKCSKGHMQLVENDGICETCGWDGTTRVVLRLRQHWEDGFGDYVTHEMEEKALER